MEIIGKLFEVSDTVVKANDFKTRDFILEVVENPQYKQYIKFVLLKDKTEIIDNYTINQFINVHFNLRGRRWVNPQGEISYFNSLEAWKIQAVQEESKTKEENTTSVAHTNNDIEDDLPF